MLPLLTFYLIIFFFAVIAFRSRLKAQESNVDEESFETTTAE